MFYQQLGFISQVICGFLFCAEFGYLELIGVDRFVEVIIYLCLTPQPFVNEDALLLC